MASSPETAPSGKGSNNTSSPPSNSSNSPSPSPPPSSPPPPTPADSKAPPPSPSKNSPPPSSPPPSSPPPSSPPPSSPPPSSPPPSSPPPDKNKGSPPPPSESPPPSSPPPKATPPPPTSKPTPPAAFSPPPPIKAPSPPGAPKLTPPPPRSSAPSHSSPSRSSHSSSDSSNNDGAIIAGAIVGGAVLLGIVIVAMLCIIRKRRKPAYYIDPNSRPSTGGDQRWNAPAEHIVKIPPPPGIMVPPRAGWVPIHSSSPGSNSPSLYEPHHWPGPISPNMNLGRSEFSYDELAAATGGFSQAKILGQGGFGYVYKGVLPSGQEVAVKSLKSGSGQGEREFQAEVEIISRVHHRHLVSLVGYCMTNEQRMLVYEFVPNSTLEFHLHGKGQPVMDWATRIRIARGSAKGLAYLHEDCHPKIIHRDIKAANILLDNKFEAMVADFGLAKLSSDNITHVSTRVMGTFGYLAPEYASSGKLTEKSDVFSFGVMLLELITGRKPIDLTSKLMEDSLVDWARPLMTKALESGNYDEIVDPRLEGNYVPQELEHMVSAASSSIRHSARMRPRMSQILRTLEGDQSSFDNEIIKPGQSMAFGVSQAYDTKAYNADMLKFKKMVMNSQEFPSSEFGGNTSEYNQFSTSSDTDANLHSGNLHKVQTDSQV